ncbi:type II toxin-antitoxin system RelE/ParE family toxin [Leptospira interrogans]|uniref:type II toxin-antitoxin system RelE/ParE family toxin n=1 Tax=Leptospira interrogans TaxID=173 RepID=UPI001F4CDE0C|nr:type II toxin-antitoxin system RelE/ParE family toxin [Leptospira interrogans]UNE67085.1 type II toxin-antitoxin system RelE/ParE family toxin [Leptospira interrogans]UNE67130.1 type II toxin-antitoxin system RelE/ParE family toxin [Leptospira interrogans]
MNFKVFTLPKFDRQAKRLIKKFPSLKKEIAGLIESLKTNPTQGTKIALDCYKIRLSIASKGKGKSGGARVITHFLVKDTAVFLMLIYDKAEQENVSNVEIEELLKEIEIQSEDL